VTGPLGKAGGAGLIIENPILLQVKPGAAVVVVVVVVVPVGQEIHGLWRAQAVMQLMQ
jgi:hypothetical protein